MRAREGRRDCGARAGRSPLNGLNCGEAVRDSASRITEIHGSRAKPDRLHVAVVIDASVALDWFSETSSEFAKRTLDVVVAEGAIVPALWRWEVQDVLRRLALAERLTKTVEYIRAELRELPIAVDEELTTLFGAEARVATRFGLSLYDAAYLELALRRNAPLATADEALMAAALAADLPRLR